MIGWADSAPPPYPPASNRVKRYLCEEDSYNQGGQCHHGLGEPQLNIQQNQPTNKEYNAMMYSDDVLCIEDLIYLSTSKPGELVPWLAI